MLPRLVKLCLHTLNIAARYNAQHQCMHPKLPAQGYDTEVTLESTLWEHGINSLHSFLAILPSRIHLPNSTAPPSRHALVRRGLLHAGFSSFLLLLFVGGIALGVVTAWLETDSLALSNDPQCGIYIPKSNGDRISARMITAPYEFHAESDSANYANDCYGKGHGSKRCNTFLHQDIQYSVAHNDSCPFDDTMCYLGPNSSFTLRSSPIPARTLGINTKGRYQFRRETTFTPLNMNNTF